MIPFLLLIAGLVALVVSSHALVSGASTAAHRLHVPPFIIGLTVVALGTSAPELLVSMQAALSGSPGLAVGNIVGSNIANILLVLGLPAVIYPITLQGGGVRLPALFLLAVSALFVWLAQDGVLSGPEGALFLGLLAVYLAHSFWTASSARTESLAAHGSAPGIGGMGGWMIALLIVAGIVGLAIGSTLTIEGAIRVAENLGISDAVIGLTVIAVGTSLPELAAGVTAAIRRQSAIAIGNVIGSNIFNSLGILGITAVVIPLDVPDQIAHFDFWIMMATALAILPLAFWMHRISRPVGAIMVAAYAAYMIVVFQSGVIA
jgi:cation:H+ antiporter